MSAGRFHPAYTSLYAPTALPMVGVDPVQRARDAEMAVDFRQEVEEEHAQWPVRPIHGAPEPDSQDGDFGLQ